MNEKQFFAFLLNNDLENEVAYKAGYEAGVSEYWNEEGERRNPYQVESLDWWIFEEGKGQAGQDL